MATLINPYTEAYGAVEGSGGGAIFRGKGASVSRLSAGLYRLTLDREINLSPGATCEGTVSVTLKGGGSAINVAYTIVDKSHVDITTTAAAASGGGPLAAGIIDGLTTPGAIVDAGFGYVPPVVFGSTGLYLITFTQDVNLNAPGFANTASLQLTIGGFASPPGTTDAAIVRYTQVGPRDVQLIGESVGHAARNFLASFALFSGTAPSVGPPASVDADWSFTINRFAPP